MSTLDLSAARKSMTRSGIRAFMDLAWETKNAIHLEVGEPNFPTPPHVVEAAARAARGGRTKYVANAGIDELRQSIARKLQKRNLWEVAADRVVITAGGVQALYLSLLALLEPGDSVLMPDPGWPNFRLIATVLNGVAQPYRLRAEDRYQPRVDDLAEALTPRTKALILNSPSNPAGSVVSASRLAEILSWARESGIWVISDECYDEIVFDGDYASAGAVGPVDNLISCYSFSKTYAMTGWRVGYAVAADKEVSDCLVKLQEPLVSCVNVPAQAAAVAALEGPQDVVGEMRATYRARRDDAVTALAAGGVRVLTPSGAFYLWVDVSRWIADDWRFAVSLLKDAGVAVAPGSAFGSNGKGHLRISLATDTSSLVEGIARILDYIPRLGQSEVTGK